MCLCKPFQCARHNIFAFFQSIIRFFSTRTTTTRKIKTMSYTTIGTISSLKWTASSLTFNIDPIQPYAFEESDTKEKFVLWNEKTNIVKVRTTIKFEAKLGEPTMSFTALLLLKQNRTRVELACDDPTKDPIPISSLSVIN